MDEQARRARIAQLRAELKQEALERGDAPVEHVEITQPVQANIDIEITRFSKGKDVVRVLDSTFQGRRYLNVREWYFVLNASNEPTLRPGKNGFSINDGNARKLRDAINVFLGEASANDQASDGAV